MALEEQTISRSHTEDAHEKASKPAKLSDVSGSSWKYIFKRALSEFTNDGCTDLAAALTYFTVLSIFPALLAVVSLLGVFGQGQQTTDAILGFLQDYAPAEMLTLLEDPITQLTSSSAAGLALVTGIIGALWTASGYTGAFGRAMNKIYGVVEGRPIWKLRPFNLLVTAVMVLIIVTMMLVLLSSVDVLTAIQDAIPAIELGSFIGIWMWLRYPIMLGLAVILISLLYFATPNVKQPKFRFLSPGAAIALVVMALAGVGFSFYVSNFSSYNATYGLIGGVIVMLLFIWIMNNVLLLGAQIDAEIQRGRELQAGIKAEDSLRLPPRDDTMAIKLQKKKENLVEEGRQIRLQHNGVDFAEMAKKQDGKSGQ
ncbi:MULTISPECIES: YihY/virulence factor BrkB family protein [Rothia]|uniref:Ribonuclease BN n=1 Tax=Rothia nasimurium TaxID=85336 RepID=A0A1Y1RR92_9MICC|nr:MULTISPECIES: YihY/virulence factor BrkB family protein [Rothia]ORC22239.1 ribonuclease BN [Rothia nasimurium]